MKRMYVSLFVLFVALNLPVYAQDDATPAPAPAVEVEPPPVIEEPPIEEPPTDPALVALAVWFGMAGAVTGFLEQVKVLVLKPAQARFSFSDEVYGALVMIVAFGASAVLVFTVGDGKTIFDSLGLSISNLVVAQIATAFVISLGNQALHQLYNLFIGWRTPILAIEEIDTESVSFGGGTTIQVTGDLSPAQG